VARVGLSTMRSGEVQKTEARLDAVLVGRGLGSFYRLW
jgi:hypothetical protein